MSSYNPWHGCHKISSGCLNCYVYRIDSKIEKDASIVYKTQSFNLPVRKDKSGRYRLKASDGIVHTCFSSDFLLDEADQWRKEVWKMMKERSDLTFFFITKRIDRLKDVLPEDWGDGYDNVIISSTCENQDRLDYRAPFLIDLPIKSRRLQLEPLLEDMEIEKYLATGKIDEVSVGGESGEQARICDFRWILHIREQCLKYNVPFNFHQTGEHFIKDGKLYNIARKDQLIQAKKSGLDTR